MIVVQFRKSSPGGFKDFIVTRLFAGTPFDQPPTCDRCGKLEEECGCPAEVIEPERLAPEKQRAKVRLDRRKHKRSVTVVAGLAEPATDLADLLSKLKQSCGAGGTISEGQIEIQGDHVERVTQKLAEIGYRIK